MNEWMSKKPIRWLLGGWRSKAVSKKRKQTSFPHRKITPSAFFPSHRRHFVNFMYLLRDGDISWTMTSSGHFFAKWANLCGHFQRVTSYGHFLVNTNENFWLKENNIFLCRPKGQLISKCPYEKSVSSKIPMKIFLDFCPEIFCSFLGASW